MKDVAVVMLLSFLVNLLLLFGADTLTGYPCKTWRKAVAASIAGAYSGLCLLPECRPLAMLPVKLLVFTGMSFVAFGVCRGALRKGILFVILEMALGGTAMWIGKGGIWSILGSAVCVVGLSMLGFWGNDTACRYLRVILRYGERWEERIALVDTGNQLRDPITGENVLIAGPDEAWKLLGIGKTELSDPIRSIATLAIPGLRLIPYRSLGQPSGMLLGIRLQNVTVGKQNGSRIVAFAPDGIGGEGYQLLTGGNL